MYGGTITGAVERTGAAILDPKELTDIARTRAEMMRGSEIRYNSFASAERSDVQGTDEVLLTGNRGIACALAQVLPLFAYKCESLNLDTVLSGKEDIPVRRMRSGGVGSTLILAAVDGVEPAQVLRYVHVLRSHAKWQGHFIAIVDDEENARSLRRHPLFGDSAAEHQYGEVPGHSVCSLPIDIPHLLTVVDEGTQLMYEVWLACLDNCPLHAAHSRIQSLLKDNQTDPNLQEVKEVTGLLSSLDWLALLVEPHRDLPKVNSTLGASAPAAGSISSRTLLEKLSALIDLTFVGGDDD